MKTDAQRFIEDIQQQCTDGLRKIAQFGLVIGQAKILNMKGGYDSEVTELLEYSTELENEIDLKH